MLHKGRNTYKLMSFKPATTMQLSFIHIILAVSISLCYGQQLLQNAGFEQPLDDTDWFCNGGCDLTQDSDAHTGLYSGRVSNR